MEEGQLKWEQPFSKANASPCLLPTPVGCVPYFGVTAVGGAAFRRGVDFLPCCFPFSGVGSTTADDRQTVFLVHFKKKYGQWFLWGNRFFDVGFSQLVEFLTAFWLGASWRGKQGHRGCLAKLLDL